MKYLAWIIAVINLYFGITNFLNLINVLKTGKYSKTSTAVFAVLFLTMGISSFYFSLVKKNYKPALIIGITPWIIALLFLLFNMLTSDYK